MNSRMETPVVANQRGSLDFVSDQMTDGRRLRILAAVDDCTRECLALAADTSLSGLRSRVSSSAWCASTAGLGPSSATAAPS